MQSTKAVLARPVRTAWKSTRAAWTAAFISSSASRNTSSTTEILPSYHRTHPFSAHRLDDPIALVKVEDDDGDPVIHAERRCRRIHHAESRVEHVEVIEWT